MSKPRGIHAFTHWRSIWVRGVPSEYAIGCESCDYISPPVEVRHGNNALGRAAKMKANVRAHWIAEHADKEKA